LDNSKRQRALGTLDKTKARHSVNFSKMG